jgi:RNA polymerase sigma-70 factor (TIGR02943 family)
MPRLAEVCYAVSVVARLRSARRPVFSMDSAERPASRAESWLAEHGDALLRFALARVGSLAVAEDLVQETLLAALQAESQFAGKSSPQTWLIAILRRKIVDHYRRQAREPASVESFDSEVFDQRGIWKGPLPAWGTDPARLAEDAEFRDVLRGCTESLPATLRGAVELRMIQDLSLEETCSLLAISPTNLSVRLNRARLALRECLDRRWFRPR